MACRLCVWLSRQFGPDCTAVRDSIADRCDEWERAASNDYELWSEQSDYSRDLSRQALAIQDTDPDAAFRLYLEAAEAGSAWAMEVVGSCYHSGNMVQADFGLAQDFYYRALSAGSWMATIRYARLLEAHGYFDHCEDVLQDGVENGFIPSFFWLAWFRYKRSRTTQTAREIRPLLERAAEWGHPEAELLIARLMMRGRFGIRHIPDGLRRLTAIVASTSPNQPRESSVLQPAS